MNDKIQDVPETTSAIDGEWILPVAEDFNKIHHRISINELAKDIRDRIMEGDEIEMIVTEHGIRFRRVK